ncbi:MAG: L-histidine N(alpha)-methyltransferase [Pigmentiphaga sp.]
MTPSVRARPARATYTFHDHAPQESSFEAALVQGLSTPLKSIPFRFLYDAAGSALFEKICEQPEYYPTRTEMRILEREAPSIARLAGPRAQLVELGSGAGQKIKLLLDAMIDPAAYISVEISRAALTEAADGLADERPDLDIHAVWADYSTPFVLPLRADAGRVVGFFPGSSIGNFEPEQARSFLALWARRLGPDADMIVGVDLIKPVDVLERAYDDAAGVTAAFSLNLLRRANRELHADFDLTGFRHEAHYRPASGAVEIHLVSQRQQAVHVAGHTFAFAEGERLHIENSHKYSLEGFAALAQDAGFQWHTAWTDPRQWFSVHYLRTPGTR